MNHVDADLYAQFVERMPISCADLLIRYGSRFLLGLRKQQPAQGEWWFPGGRQRHGELLHECAERKLLEETGIHDFKYIRKEGYYETRFDESAFGVPAHTVNHLFIVESNTMNVVPHKTLEDLVWYDTVNPDWPEPVRKILTMRGFRYPD